MLPEVTAVAVAVVATGKGVAMAAAAVMCETALGEDLVMVEMVVTEEMPVLQAVELMVAGAERFLFTFLVAKKNWLNSLKCKFMVVSAGPVVERVVLGKPVELESQEIPAILNGVEESV